MFRSIYHFSFFVSILTSFLGTGFVSSASAGVEPPFVLLAKCKTKNTDETSYKSLFGWYPANIKMLLGYGKKPKISRNADGSISLHYEAIVVNKVNIPVGSSDQSYPMSLGDSAAVEMQFHLAADKNVPQKMSVRFGGSKSIYSSKATPLVVKGTLEWSHADLQKMTNMQVQTFVTFTDQKGKGFGGMNYFCSMPGSILKNLDLEIGN